MGEWLQVGNSWRTNDDISLGIEAEWKGVVYNLDATVGLSRFAGPGGWNDAGKALALPPACNMCPPYRICFGLIAVLGLGKQQLE